MINKLIYLPIEIKKREFDSRCYQALKLTKKGFKVVICTKTALRNYMDNMPKGVVYFKSLGPRNTEMLKGFKQRGFLNILADEEGLSLKNEELYLNRMAVKNFKYINLIFTWGNADKKTIEKISHKINIYPVGNSRIDLLLQPTKNIYFKEAKKLKKKYGKFILLNSYLTRIIHFTFKNVGSYLNAMKLQKSGYKNYKIAYEMAKQETKSQNIIWQDYQKFLHTFSTSFPRYKLIVRPHPSEDHKIWEEIIKKYKNIFYIKDNNIPASSWMLASIFSISSNCTTSIESFLLNKFNINYRPNIPNIRMTEFLLPKICALNVSNNKDLIRFIKKNYSKNNLKINYFSKNHKKKLIHKIENYKDKKCSVEKFSEILENQINFKNKIDYDKFINLTLYKKIRLSIRKILVFLDLKIFKRKMTVFALQKNPGFDENEIFFRVNKFKKDFKYKFKIKVSQEAPGLFLIEKK